MTRNSMIAVDSVPLNVKVASILFRRMANYSDSKTAIFSVFDMYTLAKYWQTAGVFTYPHADTQICIYVI